MADLNPAARQVLLDLADRCKREEPSRDLDLAILNAIHAPSPEWVWRSGDETITRLVYGEGAPGNPVCSLDAYTTSLDAAVTLVPEGCSWDVRFRSHHDCAVDVGEDWATRHPTKHSAHVWRMAHRGLYDIRENGTAKTPALALCAAALRARAEAL